MKDFLIFFCALIVLGAHAMPEKKPVEYVNPMFYGEWHKSRARDGITGSIKITPGHISHVNYEGYEICEDPIINTEKTIIMECEYFSYMPVNGSSILPTQPKSHGKSMTRLDLKTSTYDNSVSFTMHYRYCSSFPYTKEETLRLALENKFYSCSTLVYYKKDIGDPKNPTIRAKKK